MFYDEGKGENSAENKDVDFREPLLTNDDSEEETLANPRRRIADEDALVSEQDDAESRSCTSCPRCIIC